MAWIIAAGAVASALLSSQAQGSASDSATRQAALQSNRPSTGSGAFTPTAQAAQQTVANPSAASSQQRPQQQPPQPAESTLFSPDASAGEQPQAGGDSSGGSGALSNVNQAVQLGATLQQVFNQQQTQGQNARSQALANSRPGQAPQYQPTALDPRLQQLLGGG